jgi:hypothetical protein
LEPGAGHWGSCSAPGAGPGSPNRGRKMSGNRVPNVSPLRSPGAGPGSRDARDFLGSPCPRGRFLGGRLLGGLFADELDEFNGLDFDELLRARGIIDDPIDSSEDCECEFDDEFIEHLNNKEW